MKKLSIIAALALATVWTWTPAFAYSNVSPKPAPQKLTSIQQSMHSFSIGTSSADIIGSASGLGNAAGSIAAGANSALNPSGNSFIVPPPGAIGAGEFVRPQR
jgi:hypothetical protein